MRYPIQTHLCLPQKLLIKDNNKKLIQQVPETGLNLWTNKSKILESKDRN